MLVREKILITNNLLIQQSSTFHSGSSLSHERPSTTTNLNIKDEKPITSLQLIKYVYGYIWPKVKNSFKCFSLAFNKFRSPTICQL